MVGKILVMVVDDCGASDMMVVAGQKVDAIFVYSSSARLISFEGDCFYGMRT